MKESNRQLGYKGWMALVFGLATALCLFACRGGKESMVEFKVDPSLKDEMNKVARFRVFFGHQSVGGNIVQGLEELKGMVGVDGFTIVHYQPGAALPSAFFADKRVGVNGHPQGKFDEFCNLLDEDLAGKVDIALVKICYVDLGAGTHNDPETVFDAYVKAVRAMESRHPGLVLIPVTSPLRIREGWEGRREHLLILLKEFFGYKDDNAARAIFNEKIRETFHDRPIFDLAAVESTYPDGRRETYGRGGKCEGLIRAYSSDGGHLNEVGRKIAARELIRVLSRISLPSK